MTTIFTCTHIYCKIVKIPGTNATVHLVFIDTIILCGTAEDDDDDEKEKGLPHGPQSPSEADNEWAWIETTLHNSKADWILVFGHYPGMSVD